MTPSFDLSRYQDPLTIQRVHPHRQDHRDRRAVEERAARQLLRRLLPQAPRLPGDSGQPARDGDPRREELQEPARRAGSRRHRQRLPRAGRAAGHRQGGGGDRRRNLWCQFTVINEEGGAHRRGRRPVGGHGSLPQGRARPLRRTDALARLQHPAHHVGARRTCSSRWPRACSGGGAHVRVVPSWFHGSARDRTAPRRDPPGARGWRAGGDRHGGAGQRERVPPRRHADVRPAGRHVRMRAVWRMPGTDGCRSGGAGHRHRRRRSS